MNRIIPVVSFDPSMSHFGIAKATVDLETSEVVVQELKLVNTAPEDKRVMVKSSDDLRRARECQVAMEEACEGRAFAFAEIPFMHATMYPSAILNTGIVIGILSSCPLPIIQVQPQAVKLATVGTRQAAKEEMIAWAVAKHPTAPWITVKRKGAMVPTAANEHLADAVAAIYAGLHTDQFKQVQGLYQSTKAVTA